MEKPRRQNLCQYRSNLDNVVKVISETAFTKFHKSKLKQVCPFWKLCAAIFKGELTRQKCRKSDLQMFNIINKYDKKRNGFKINKHFATIKRDQVQRIFGIHNKGMTAIEITPEGRGTTAYKQFVDRRFPGVTVMTKSSIEMALAEAVNGTTEEDIDDVARIVTLFLLDTLFVPNSCMSLAWGYLKFVHGDVRDMKSYDWATHIYEKLIESMGHHNPARLPGCVIAIPYIILENFSLCTPEEGKKYTKTVLCTKWNLKDFFNMMVECKTVEALLDDEGKCAIFKPQTSMALVNTPGTCNVLPLNTKKTAPRTPTGRQPRSSLVIDLATTPVDTKRKKKLPPKPKKKIEEEKEEDEKLAKEIDDDVDDPANMINTNKTAPRTPNTPTGRQTRSSHVIDLTTTPIATKHKKKLPPKPKKNIEEEKREDEKLAKEIDDDVEDPANMMNETDNDVDDPAIMINQTLQSIALECNETEGYMSDDPLCEMIRKEPAKTKRQDTPESGIEKMSEKADAEKPDSENTASDFDTNDFEFPNEVFDEKETNQLQIERVMRDLGDALEQVADLKKKVVDDEKRREEEAEKMAKLLYDSENAAKRRIEEEEKMAKLKQELDEANKIISALKTDDDLKVKLVETEKSWKEEEEKVAKLMLDIDIAAKNKLEEEAKITKLTNDLKNAYVRVSALQTELDNTKRLASEKNDCNQSEEQLPTLKKDSTESEEFANLKNKLLQKEETLKDMEKKITEAHKLWRRKEEQYEIQNRITGKRIQQLTSQNENYQQMIEDLQKTREELITDIEELSTHNVTQKHRADQVIKDILNHAEIHNTTQVDSIRRSIIAELELEYEGKPNSRIDRLKKRTDRRPKIIFTPAGPLPLTTDSENEPPQRTPPRTRRQKRKQTQVIDYETPKLDDPSQIDAFKPRPNKQRKKPPPKKNEPAPTKQSIAEGEPDEEEGDARKEKTHTTINPMDFLDDEAFERMDMSVFEDVVPEVEKVKAHKLITKKNETPVTQRLPQELFDRIKQIHTQIGPMTSLFHKHHDRETSYNVCLDDVYKIIDGDELCNSVVNAFGYLLEMELNAKERHSFTIFDSLCWTLIHDPKYKDALETNINVPLRNLEKHNYRLLLFPMNSNRQRNVVQRPDHYTLLVIDTEKKKARFYNSNLPRGDSIKRIDPYAEDAKDVMKYVVKKMVDMSSLPNFSLDSQDFYDFEQVQDCPYQGRSVDCALYTCYNMNSVVRGHRVTKNVSASQMLDFKVQMIALMIGKFDEQEKEKKQKAEKETQVQKDEVQEHM